MNTLVDLSNYETPLSYYFDSSSYLIDNNGLFVQKEVYFTPIDVITDEKIGLSKSKILILKLNIRETLFMKERLMIFILYLLNILKINSFTHHFISDRW